MGRLVCVGQVRAESGIVAIIIPIVDRLKGAAEMLAGQGITLAPLPTADDFDVAADA